MKIITILFFLAQVLSAQVIVTENAKGKQPLEITKMDFKVSVIDFLAETEVTMTFANPNHGDMIGNFYLPMPEDSQVISYALDVKGVLIEAVAVEKVRARQVFEAITRRRVDPGLLEWSKGNNFKTRVYPLPGKGTRTIQVKILSLLKKNKEGFVYKFPLKFKDQTNILNLEVESQSSLKPVILSKQFDGMSFKKSKTNSFNGTVKKFKLKPESIEILFPNKENEWKHVFEGSDKKLYYAWAKEVKQSSETRLAENTINLLWDASHSRKLSKIEKDIKVLEGICKKLPEKTVIDLLVFRNDFEPLRSFKVKGGKCRELISFLKSLTYDGGTYIDAAKIQSLTEAPGEIIIFTDGLSTLNSPSSFDSLKSYVTIVNSNERFDNLLFDKMLTQARGKFINLNHISVEQAVNMFFANDVKFDRAAEMPEDCFSMVSQSSSDIAVVTGVLEKDELHAKISGRLVNAVQQKLSFEVGRKESGKNKLTESFFAVKKLESLIINEDRSKILAHGLKYHLSTPYTSVIVLESYNDYVRYNIEPPETMPEWREKFLTKPVPRNSDFSVSKKWIARQMMNQWGSFLRWFDSDFDYPENFARHNQIFFVPDHFSYGLMEIVETASSDGDDPFGEAPALVGGVADPFAEPASSGGSGGSAGLDDPFGSDAGDGGDPFGSEPERTIENGEIESVTVKVKDREVKSSEFSAMQKSAAPYKIYLTLKDKFGHIPDFYLKSAKILFKAGKTDKAVRVASNCAEIMGENVANLRKLAIVLTEMKQHKLTSNIYQLILEERPDEPQSWRDLALSYSAQKKYQQAASTLIESLDKNFKRFKMKDVLLLELNRVLRLAFEDGVKVDTILDPELLREIELDVRFVLTWNTDNYNLNMSVLEPSNESVYYTNDNSTIGGRLTHQFTSYGPEQYVLKKAMKGQYKIYLRAGSDRTQENVGDTYAKLEVYTDFGRKYERLSTYYFVFNNETRTHELTVGIGIKEGKKEKKPVPEYLTLTAYDSLISIAANMKRYGFNWDQVKKANPDFDWLNLNVGQRVRLPETK